ncbi:hypothetical protein B6N60_04352 [Richelia sinica FACHB-800]|uniref:Uncharacterized protein n=1 Tax=Richelia sinica FACHB-800 TaxID=1357546 RepID=A0A975Y6U6_9NOST|nr:hypothetical protein [Richelia sinica]MBD2665499.1 hypothetical protein [Richelia sinica FACHB-800]QXE25632.1 hypothetical protein B6N60_04352 [Richelia sinica FACHB-800]
MPIWLMLGQKYALGVNSRCIAVDEAVRTLTKAKNCGSSVLFMENPLQNNPLGSYPHLGWELLEMCEIDIKFQRLFPSVDELTSLLNKVLNQGELVSH